MAADVTRSWFAVFNHPKNTATQALHKKYVNGSGTNGLATARRVPALGPTVYQPQDCITFTWFWRILWQ